MGNSDTLQGEQVKPKFLEVLQTVAGLAVLAAMMFSWLWTLTFWNRVVILRDRDKYRPETFLVTGVEYASGEGEDAVSFWLVGSVANRQERMVPRTHGSFIRHQRKHPSGSLP